MCPEKARISSVVRIFTHCLVHFITANGNLDKMIELRSDWAFQNKKGESGTTPKISKPKDTVAVVIVSGIKFFAIVL